MRLKRLDLARYGKFTDKVLDFGELAPGEADFHIVFGPNEAGKSTVFSAWLDLLYGIGTQTPYAFLHPYNTMRIGATLELESGTRTLARIKRPQNSLLDSNDQPVSESLLLGALGGLDRNGYHTMFSLDDETLEEGGKAILASKGDLGQLLFSASAGLADLARNLIAIQASAEAFHKGRARSTELARLKGQLEDMKAERARIDVLASDHARLSEACRQARDAHEAATGERARLRVRRDELQRHLAVMPRLDRLARLRRDLAEFEPLPEPPGHWRDALPELHRQTITLSVQLDHARRDIETLAADLAAIGRDEAALAEAAPHGDLDGLAARFVTETADLPRRQIERGTADALVAGIVVRLGRGGDTEPARLLLPTHLKGSLTDLMTRHSGVASAFSLAGRELSDARHRLVEAEGELSAATGDADKGMIDPARLAWLATFTASLRTSDHAGRVKKVRHARNEAQAGLEKRLHALRPFSGSAEELASIMPPDRTGLEDLRARLEDSRQQRARRRDELARLAGEIRIAEAERASLTRFSGLVTDEEAATIRHLRDAAWARHRGLLDGASADAFAELLRDDDRVGAARLGQASEAAALRQVDQSLARLVASHAEAQGSLDEAETRHSTVSATLVRLLAELSPDLPASWGTAELEAWLGWRDLALEALAQLRASERALAMEEKDLVEARARLESAFLALGIAHDGMELEAMMGAAQAIIDRDIRLSGLRRAIADRRRDVAGRERTLDHARQDLDQWRAEWEAACRACWLGEDGTIPPIAGMAETLKALDELATALSNRAVLADRIAKMERDMADFSGAVAAIATRLEMAAGTGDPLLLYRAIGERVRKAREAGDRHHEEAERLDRRRKDVADIEESLAIVSRQVSEMTGFFGVDTLDEVEAMIDRIDARRNLETQIADISGEILSTLRMSDIEDAEARIGALDSAAIEAELAALGPAHDEQDRRCQELFSAYTKARDALDAIGSDGDVARIEEQRRTVLLSIEDGARRYLKLQLGRIATESALRLYRDRHRSSMMSRASEAFRIMSRGHYTGLATQPDKDGEILIALSADGGSKEAAELSKGTRFQLYLALRVAGYHEYAQSRASVPFIADDIMETFDDFRAEEALGLFASMAATGQVIYFTHHSHLCDIARKVCPTVKVHDIGGHEYFTAA